MAGYIGSKASVVSSGAERKKVFAITTTTTSLTGLSYTPTKVHVYHNGIRLVDGTDYTATNGTSITLTNAAESGDEVVVVSYATFQVADAYTQAEADAEFVQDPNDVITVSGSNVGIGNVSPASQLSVGGNPPAAGAIAAVGASGGVALALSDNVNSSLYVRNASGGSILGTDSGGNLRFATNGNTAAQERMRIDASGRVTMPYQPVISGQIGTALTSPNALQIIAFNEFWTSVGITYNSTTRRFTVPVAGNYRITMNPFFRAAAPNARVLVGVNNDAPSGSNHYGHAYRQSSDYETGCINSVVSLAANDYIVFYLSSGGLYNQSSDRFNQFSIQLIG